MFKKARILLTTASLLASSLVFNSIPSFALTPVIGSPLIFEAEDGLLEGGAVVQSTLPGYSGTGYVGGFQSTKDNLTFNVNTQTGGVYDLVIGCAAPYGYKQANVKVNGVSVGSISMEEGKDFREVKAGKVKLNSGENTISINGGWNWYVIDYITLTPAGSVQDPSLSVNKTLSNPNASKEAKQLYAYLLQNYGKKIISGQQEFDQQDAAWIEKNTGKYPAILGLDLLNYSPYAIERGADPSITNHIQRALDWHKKGGIVTFAWHWYAPSGLIEGTKDGNPTWWGAFYTDRTTFNLEEVLKDPECKDYQLLIRDIDAISEQLKILQDANIPVLWRPLHEAEGGWFWWGGHKLNDNLNDTTSTKHPEACKELYRIMYDRMTNYHHLDNLIWIWNSTSKEWYPGDEYVDIISADSYPSGGDYSPISSVYDQCVELGAKKKLVAMSENGPIPDPELLKEYGAYWSWFCTWNGFQDNSSQNSLEHVKAVYNNDYVLTLEDVNYQSIVVETTSPTPSASVEPSPTNTATPTPSSSSTTILKGDADLDGSVNIMDAVLLKRHILGLTTLSGDSLQAADLNDDEDVNILDARLLKKIILGM